MAVHILLSSGDINLILLMQPLRIGSDGEYAACQIGRMGWSYEKCRFGRDTAATWDVARGWDAMTGGWRSKWLQIAFWTVTGLESAWFLTWFADFASTGPQGEFGGLAAIVMFVIACVLALIMLLFALVRNRVVRGIALVLVVGPPLSWGVESSLFFLRTPGEEALAAGHGYFTRPADRALADAVVAGDSGKVAERASAANTNAIGWNGMTFLKLALNDGHGDPAIVAALLRAGADPDQDNQLLFGYMTEDSGDNGLMIRQKNLPLLRAVAEAGVDLNHENQENLPRFFSALKWPEGLAIMLEHGANTETEDKDGNTAITWAVKLSYWPSIDVLLAHGASIDHVAHDGQSVRDAVQAQLDRFQRDRGNLPPQLAALMERLH